MNENPYENFYGKDNDSYQSPNYDANANNYAHSIEEQTPTVYGDVAPLAPTETFPNNTTENTAENTQSPSSWEWYKDTASENTPITSPPYDPPVTEERKKKRSRRSTPVALILVLCIVLSSVFGAGSAYVVNKLTNTSKQIRSSDGLTINQINPEYDNNSDDGSSGLSTVDIVDVAADSVVEIITEYVETGSFAQQYIKSGAGSGVVVDSTGYIVTNYHVIENARKITVTLRSGDSYNATIVGYDSQMDLALLKIDAENLTAAVFADSDKLRVGERTVAIGNPLGQLGGSVTEGIISALNRDVVVDGQTMNLLQTDTAINPGNSGGGLFNSQGNLIGIIVAKSSGSEVEGLGFAIPVNDVLDVIADLKEHGYVRGRVDLGMEFIDVNSVQVAWMYGLSETGCYVYDVDRGSNAESAGFKSGDLILKVSGTSVSTSDDIEAILEDKAVDEEVVFTVKRGESTGDITLKLQEYVPNPLGDADEDSYFQWFDDFGY